MKYKPGFDALGISAGFRTPTTGTEPVLAMFPHHLMPPLKALMHMLHLP